MKKILLFLISGFLLFGCSEDSINPEEQDDFSGKSGTFIDERDGHEYKWVKIGEQTWMAENLAYLPNVNRVSAGSFSEPCYYVYNYTATDVNAAKATETYLEYGVLYNWLAAKVASPDGWHIASNDEWEQLAQYISNQNGPYENNGYVWEDIGVHLKAKDGWYGDSGGTDDYNFKGLPGGYRMNQGQFHGRQLLAIWWSSTEESSDLAWRRDLSDDNHKFKEGESKKNLGYSIRCIKD